MAKMFTLSNRLIVGACSALLLCGAVSALAWGAAARTQQPNTNQAQPPKKKKLPPNAKGFEQYAGRDASDKLVTGGATRGGIETNLPENVAKAKDALRRGNEAYEAAKALEEAGQRKEASAKYQEAVLAYKESASAMPNMFRAHFMLGGSYEALGQYKEAAEAYKRAVALKPEPEPDSGRDPNEDLLYAYYNLGNVLASLNQHKEAIDAYKQVIVVSEGTMTKPNYNIGLSYAALGQRAEAIQAFQEAIRGFKKRAANPKFSDPTFELTYYNLGVTYSKGEQYAEAAEAFRQALALDPNHAEARYNLGIVYYLMDNRQGLMEQHKALLTAKPELAKELAKYMSQ